MNVRNLLSERLILIPLVGLLATLRGFAQSGDHRTENWIADYNVNRVEHSEGYTLLSGNFGQVGPYHGSGVVTDLTTGQVDEAMPKIHGDVYVSAADGNGGWYVGGYFSAVDTVKISNLVHIKADKTVDRSWKPNPDNSPLALLINGTTLYVGGYFNTLAGQTRNYIASFDTTTGALTTWNPNANSAIKTIATAGSLVYVGGYFSTIGGQSRTGLAALNVSNGTATAWAPLIAGAFGYSIETLALDATSVFVGGSFNFVNGISRLDLARISLTTGLTLAWVANTNGYVSALQLAGTNVYVGGSFSTINAIARNSLAAISTGGVLQTWNPGLTASDWVDDLAISGNSLYFCGYFSAVNFTPRKGIAAVDLSSANLLTWAPKPNSDVYAVTATANNVFMGGYFQGVDWVNRPDGFALFDDATNEAWPFDLDLNGGVINTIAVKDKVLYIGGQFNAINKSARKNLAAIDLTTGQVLPWNPTVQGLSPTDPNVFVSSIKIKDNLLYVGGKFYTTGAAPLVRPGLAAIDLTTGIANNWDPIVGDGKTTNQFVNTLDMVNNTVYVGGFFGLIGNLSRGNLAAVDATTGAILGWNPNSNGTVDKIKVASNAAYVVGEFANGVGGAIRTHRVAALNLTNNTATPWNPNFQNGTVNDIALNGNEIYVAGYFDAVGAQFRPGLTSFNLATGALTTWLPDIGDDGDGAYSVSSISSSQSRLYAGGNFNSLGLEQRSSFAEYDICPANPTITSNGALLSTTSTGNLQWFENGVAVKGATESTFEINALEYGVYRVEVTSNGCTARSDDFLYLITAKEASPRFEIKVYPNPAQDFITIEGPFVDGAVEFTFLDMLGRAVIQQVGTGGQHTLALHDLQPGPYLLQIQTQDTKQMRKIIKVP